MWNIAGLYTSTGIIPIYGTGLTYANLLLSGETEGFAIDATYADATPSYTGASYAGYVSVIDTGTPANNLSNVALDSSNLRQGGTSAKMVLWNSIPYVRWTPHNLALQSQDFSSISWKAATGTLTTVTADNTTAPDGTSTADKIEDVSASNERSDQIWTFLGGVVYTFSVYAKYGNSQHFAIQYDDGVSDTASINVDIQNGSITGTAGGKYLSSSIITVGDGWYLVSMTFVGVAANGYIKIFPAQPATGFAAANTGYNYFWGAQLNRGYTATPYLVTTATARIGIPQEYDTAASKFGILVEPAATNICLYSDDFTNAAWTKSNMTTAKTATGPDNGTNSASTLTATAGNATALQAITSASSARITSMWVKRRTGTGNIDITQNNGTNWTTVTVTADWTRVELASATLTDPTVGIRIVTSGDEVDVWGFQHETGSAVTSTIPTVGATVTRARDDLPVLISSIPYTDTSGSIILRFKKHVALGVEANHYINLNNGDNERIALYSQASQNDIRCFIADGGASQADVVTTETITIGAYTQIAVAYATNDVALVAAGGTPATDPDTATMPTPVDFRLGFNSSADGFCNITIFQLIHVPRRMTNGELQTATT